MSRHHNFQCDQCRQIFRLKKDLKYHKSQSHSVFSCNNCGKSFRTKGSRDHHMKRTFYVSSLKKCKQYKGYEQKKKKNENVQGLMNKKPNIL